MSVSGCTCIVKESHFPKEKPLGKDGGMGEGNPFSASKRVSFPQTLNCNASPHTAAGFSLARI